MVVKNFTTIIMTNRKKINTCMLNFCLQRKCAMKKQLLGSRIRGNEVSKSEKALGYFLGPCLTYMAYTALAGTYLTQFYTDVLGIGGILLTWMPLISKIVSGVLGLVIGRMIDKTRTSQGKARPWILASGVLVTVCGILLYAVPQASYGVQIAWVVISYNLFFSLAFNIYSLSHSLMVPLSTRDDKQRDSLAMLTSTATAMLPGMLTTIVMPLLVSKIGVGDGAQGAWLTVMGILSILAIPATLIEYYFTKERVQEESSCEQEVSYFRQIRACLRDRYWVMIMVFTLVLNICNNLSTGTMLYYCNWVLGNSVASGAAKQILVNMIGQAPMGFGVFILWPLVKKFGKRTVTVVGFSIAAAGSLLVLLAGNSMVYVLVGLFIKSIGALPTYVMTAYLAEALDHVEAANGFRVDGFSASVNALAQTVSMGLSQTLLLAGINSLGYIAPETTEQLLQQPEAVVNFFRTCFAGAPMVGYICCAVIICFYKLGCKKRP